MTEHVDMSAFIAAKSDQLNADDLMDAPRTITITKVTAAPDAAEQPVSIHYEGGEGRPFKPCKTMRRVMVGVWGRYTDKYVGQSMTLYRDAEIQFGGMKVGGIRISHMSGITEPKTLALLVTRGRKAPYTVQPLAVPKQEDAAAKWASAYIAKLATLDTAEAVADFEAQKAGKLAELQTARPELHANVTAALAERKTALEPKSDGFNMADEIGLDEPAPSESALSRIKSDLDAAGDADAVERVIAEAEQHRGAFDDAQLVALETAYSAARTRVAGQEQLV